MSVIDHLLSASNLIAKQKQEISSNLSNRWNAVSEKIVTLRNDYKLDNLIALPVKTTPISDEAQRAYDKLCEHIGSEAKVGEWFEVTQAQIDQFATVTHDNQWIHVDQGRAVAESPYRSTIAHGFLILSLIPHLMPERDMAAILGEKPKMIINSGLENVEFIRPVKPGNKIRARQQYVSAQVFRRSIRLVNRVTLETSAERPVTCADVIYILTLQCRNSTKMRTAHQG